MLYTSFVMLDLTSPFVKETAAPRIVELLKAGASGKLQLVPVAISNPGHPDGKAGQALAAAYGEASLEFARKPGAKGTDADHAVAALRTFFEAALKKPSPELKSSVLWPNGLELLEEFRKSRLLEPFLYIVATDAGLEGGREWGQAHAKDALRALLIMGRLKTNTARPAP